MLQEQIIPSKADARKWTMHLEATGLEDETTQSKQSKAEIFADLIGHYRSNRLPTVKGKSQELSRLKIIEKTLGNLQLDPIKSTVLVRYREKRLMEVGPQTVKHEIGLVL